MSSLHDDVFAISPDVRSVAVANGQQVDARSGPGLPRAGYALSWPGLAEQREKCDIS